MKYEKIYEILNKIALSMHIHVFYSRQLMAAEKRLKQEIDDLRQHIKKMQEAERKERRKLAEEDALRKIKKLEETITDLNKNLATQKQVLITLTVDNAPF